MSQENVEVVRKSIEAFNARGIEALLHFHASDVVWYSLAEWVEDPVYRGHDGARKLSATFTDNFADFDWELHDVHDAGSRVVGLVEMTGRSKDSGIQTRQQMGVVYADFRDGMIGEVRYFSTWQQALKAVGLEE
jgi:ketosteroid isomerase-like protein